MQIYTSIIRETNFEESINELKLTIKGKNLRF